MKDNLLYWTGITIAVLTTFGNIDNLISAANWAKWLIGHWSAITLFVWSHLLFFLPGMTTLDAHALTLVSAVLATMLFSLDASAHRRGRKYTLSAVLAVFILFFLQYQNLAASFNREGRTDFANIEWSVFGAAQPGERSKLRFEPDDFGYLYTSYKRMRNHLERFDPMQQGAPCDRLLAEYLTALHKEVGGEILLKPTKELLDRIGRESGADSCFSAWRRWQAIIHFTSIAILSLVTVLVAIVAPYKIVQGIRGGRLNMQKAALRLWTVIYIVGILVCLNTASNLVTEWSQQREQR